MADPVDPLLQYLPGRLKAARAALGLSLDAVSKRSGVSRSMVSQIERGESSPTIATLLNLTRALDIDFGSLMAGDPETSVITHRAASDIPVITNMGHGCDMRILTPFTSQDRPLLIEVTLAAGALMQEAPLAQGSVKLVAVLDGQIEVTAGTDRTHAAAGAVVQFAADVPHGMRAAETPARCIVQVTDG